MSQISLTSISSSHAELNGDHATLQDAHNALKSAHDTLKGAHDSVKTETDNLKAKFGVKANGKLTVRADEMLDADGNPIATGATAQDITDVRLYVDQEIAALKTETTTSKSAGTGGLSVTHKNGEILVHPADYIV